MRAQLQRILSISYLERGQEYCGSIPLTDFSIKRTAFLERVYQQRLISISPVGGLSEVQILSDAFTVSLNFFSIDNDYEVTSRGDAKPAFFREVR